MAVESKWQLVLGDDFFRITQQKSKPSNYFVCVGMYGTSMFGNMALTLDEAKQIYDAFVDSGKIQIFNEDINVKLLQTELKKMRKNKLDSVKGSASVIDLTYYHFFDFITFNKITNS